MTGLQKQIKSRVINNYLPANEKVSYMNIAHIIGCSYNTAKRKVDQNTFTVYEAIDIFNKLFVAKSKFEAFEYLFTEQPNE